MVGCGIGGSKGGIANEKVELGIAKVVEVLGEKYVSNTVFPSDKSEYSSVKVTVPEENVEEVILTSESLETN